MVIGVTLVGFGTSMPELVTSLQAALDGANGIAIGNVVGSNIANILLILGLATLIRPMTVAPAGMWRDSLWLIFASAACLWTVQSGDITRLTGLLFIAALAGYLIHSLRQSSPDQIEDLALEIPATGLQSSRFWPVGQFILGLGITILGARLLVTGAVQLADAAGVSDAIIGLTIVAIGTSLPELVTSAIAARQGRSDLALGNIVGSNIFNIFGVLGITAMVSPLTVPAQIVRVDIWVMLAATALLLVLLLATGRIGRIMGGVMLAAYAAYLVALALIA